MIDAHFFRSIVSSRSNLLDRITDRRSLFRTARVFAVEFSSFIPLNGTTGTGSKATNPRSSRASFLTRRQRARRNGTFNHLTDRIDNLTFTGSDREVSLPPCSCLDSRSSPTNPSPRHSGPQTSLTAAVLRQKLRYRACYGGFAEREASDGCFDLRIDSQGCEPAGANEAPHRDRRWEADRQEGRPRLPAQYRPQGEWNVQRLPGILVSRISDYPYYF